MFVAGPVIWREGVMRNFSTSDEGATAVIFAIALIPLVIAIGASVDYAAASNEKALLTRAADAAVLFGVTEARNRLSEGDPKWADKAKAAALGAFKANTQGYSAYARTADVSITQTTQTITVSVSSSANVPATFMKLAGKDSIYVAKKSSATTQPFRYTDLHLIVDNSPSMGIGATSADQAMLYKAIGCQVACHYKTSVNGVPNLAAARATGAVLRLDVVKNALADALAKTPNDGRTRVAIHLLGNDARTLFPLSTDLTSAISTLKAIELTDDRPGGGTDIGFAMQTLNTKLAVAGDGTSPSQPQGVVVLATDAVEDQQIIYKKADGSDNWTYDPNFALNTPNVTDFSSLHFQTFDPKKCAPIKQKGYNMFTLEVAYLIPSPVSSQYDARLNFIKNTLLPTYIPQAMAQCATTPSNYLHAETSADIVNAIKAMFSAIQSPRITM